MSEDTGIDQDHPRRTADLLGQDASEAALVAAWRSGRMPHAWLIAGPRGVGKATLAYRFARFVLAGGGATADDGPGLFGDAPAEDAAPGGLTMDPGHPVFQRTAAAGHSDLFTLESGLPNEQGKPTPNTINAYQAGRAVAFAHLTPGEAAWKVIVVDAADDMNATSANRILKALEEPPGRGLFLLVSHQPGRLLPTIRSRCRKLALGPLADETVARILRAHRPEVAEEDAAALAALAGGSAGRALALADAGGLEVHRELTGLLARLPQLDIPAVHAFCERHARAGAEDSYRAVGDLLGDWIAGAVRAGAAERRANLERWVRLWEKTVAASTRAERLTLDKKHVLLDLFLDLQATSRA